jgi:hypothetical protein
MNKKSIFSVMLVALLALSFAFVSCGGEVEVTIKVVNNYSEEVKVNFGTRDNPKIILVNQGATGEYVFKFPSTGNYAAGCQIFATSGNAKKLGEAEFVFDKESYTATVTVNADGTVTKK